MGLFRPKPELFNRPSFSKACATRHVSGVPIRDRHCRPASSVVILTLFLQTDMSTCAGIPHHIYGLLLADDIMSADNVSRQNVGRHSRTVWLGLKSSSLFFKVLTEVAWTIWNNPCVAGKLQTCYCWNQNQIKPTPAPTSPLAPAVARTPVYIA